MSQQQPGAERPLWWKVAQYLDAAQIASVNAMAHNVDDPTIIIAFQDTVRQAQAILLEIFNAKGLLPQEPPLSAPSTGDGPSAGEPPSPPPFATAPPSPPPFATAPISGFSFPWNGPSVPPPPPPPAQPEPLTAPLAEAAAPPDLEGQIEEHADMGNGHASEPHAAVLEEPPTDVPEAEAEA